MASSERLRIASYFVANAVVPGLLYQRVQDVWRPGYDGDSSAMVHLLGIAPNLLGAVSLTAGLVVLANELSLFEHINARITSMTAVSAAGLIAWEVGQIWFPHGTFDVFDVLWTFAGTAVAWAIARAWLGEQRAPVEAEVERN